MRNLKKKHSFLLLELLVAITLFTLCITPLVQLPFRTLSDAIQYYQRLELARLSDITLAKVEAELFQNAIPWKTFECNRKNKHLLFQKGVKIDITGDKEALFEKTCSLWTSRKKKGKHGEHYRLLTLEICWKPQGSAKGPVFKRRHQVLVQQLSSLPDPSSKVLPPTSIPPLSYATHKTS